MLGGSEDGNMYVWDIKTGKLLQRLKGHGGVVSHTNMILHYATLSCLINIPCTIKSLALHAIIISIHYIVSEQLND